MPNSITNQASNFNTPPPVKRIAEPITNEKPEKMRKSSQQTIIVKTITLKIPKTQIRHLKNK